MEGTIGEIRMFAGNFAPRSWAFCQAQSISIASNTALFSILGTTYGGNGQTTFKLPDFQGRMAVGVGTGPGLSAIQLGQMAGANTVTLTTANMPAHTHVLSGTVNIQAAGDGSLSTDPANRYLGPGNFYAGSNDLQAMAPAQHNLAAGSAGSGSPVSNMPPYIGMNFVICQFGIFPSRN
jgi:microcystin-dependent protein